jgi:hypothetical protein
VLRRLDCVLESTKVAVLAEKEKREKAGLVADSFLRLKSGVNCFPARETGYTATPRRST